jgi:hypothetical protein
MQSPRPKEPNRQGESQDGIWLLADGKRDPTIIRSVELGIVVPARTNERFNEMVVAAIKGH